MAKKKLKIKKKEDVAGIWVPAGVLVGVGVGLMYNQVAAYTLIGLGVGFVLMAITKLLKKK